MKKLLAIILTIFMAFSASGCGVFLEDNDQLLRSPTPGGEYEEITEVLSEELTSGYTLKYAKYGDLRSAFIVSDLDSDGEEDEALVFYSTTIDGNETLNISLFEKENEWKMMGKTAVGGTDIEKLELGDIDTDGNLEAVIGWSIYGAPETRLSVFNLSGDIPISIYESKYSAYTVYDMNADGKENLLICDIDTPSNTVKFSLHEFQKGTMTKIAECDADKSLTSVRRFVKSKVGGHPAVFVDASLGMDAYFTELIYFDGKQLSAPLYEQSGQTHSLTMRFNDIPSQDIDLDGDIDIPCQSLLPGAEDGEKSLYLTTWKSYSGDKLKTTERSIISASMQYRFKVKKSWVGAFTAVSSASDGMIFYNYSADKGRGEELFELRYSSLENADDDEAGAIYSDETSVATLRIYSKDSEMDVDHDAIKKRFEKMNQIGDKN